MRIILVSLYCIGYSCCKIYADRQTYYGPKVSNLTESNSLCPKHYVIRNNASFSNATTLFGYDFELYWSPWVRQYFPRCWQALQSIICVRTNQKDKMGRYASHDYEPCKSVCLKAWRSCGMLKEFTSRKILSRNDILDCNRYVDIIDHQGKKVCDSNITTGKVSVCGHSLHESHLQILSVVSWKELISVESSIYGCSLLCNSSFHIHQPHHSNVYVPTIISCSIGSMLSFFTILTFLVDWKSLQRYPAAIIFMLNLCFLTLFIGFLMQFFGIGNRIRCSPNEYRRMRVPKYPGSSWCLISFILIYFSSIAISCWFVILLCSWYISFKSLCSTKNYINGKVKYFHLTAWGIPTLMTVIVIFVGAVDSHEFTNICYLGYSSTIIRIIFVYVPYVTALLLGEIFILFSINNLLKLREECKLFLVPRAATNITHTVIRLIFYGSCMLIVVSVPILGYIVEGNNKIWHERHNHYVKCLIVKSALLVEKNPLFPEGCIKPSNMKLSYFYVQLFCLFLGCLVTNSWTWTNATWKIWSRLWKRFFFAENEMRFELQMSWYKRIKNNKVHPFPLPLKPAGPLDANVSRRLSENYGLGQFFSVNDEDKAIAWNSKRHSDSMRSVIELFNARRVTSASIESHEDLLNSSAPLAILRRSMSVNSLQNYGRLVQGNLNGDYYPVRSVSSNLTVTQIKNVIENGRRYSNLTLTQLKSIRDNVYTPISLTHRDNIVADCIPYATLQPLQGAERILKWNESMEPCSISSMEDL